MHGFSGFFLEIPVQALEPKILRYQITHESFKNPMTMTKNW